MLDAGTDTSCTIEKMWIYNNIFAALDSARLKACISSDVGNPVGPQPGAVTIIGNTCDLNGDAVMESVSQALCKEYLNEFGVILHHNIDKGLLAAGRVEKRFGGGKVVFPMELTIGDRASSWVNGRKVPVKEIAVETAREWFANNLRFVDPKKDVTYRCVLNEGSGELTDIFSRTGGLMGANDTSATVGYYPLSPMEECILSLEGYLNSREFKEKFLKLHKRIVKLLQR